MQVCAKFGISFRHSLLFVGYHMSSLCCCCGSKGGSLEESVRLSAADDDVVASGELSPTLYAAMWCRSSGSFEFSKAIGQVGLRQQKSFCWLTRRRSASASGLDYADSSGGSPPGSSWWRWLAGSQPQLVVASVTVCSVPIHERHHLLRALELSTSNPLLLPILTVDLPRDDRLIVVREWCAAGSLRDVIHGVSPESLVHSKYDRVGSPLSESKCASIGRALIDGLLVLRPLGARACLHVHCGNIFLRGERPLLAEWEQGLLGLPSHLAEFANDLARTLEPAAAALALCLYEMACGFELDGIPAVFPPSCPRAVRDTLDEMLRTPARKEKRPPRTLEEVLELPLFAHAEVIGGARGAAREPLSEVALEHVRHLSSARGDPI